MEFEQEYPSDTVVVQIYEDLFLRGIDMRELSPEEARKCQGLLDEKLAELKAQGAVFKNHPGISIPAGIRRDGRKRGE